MLAPVYELDARDPLDRPRYRPNDADEEILDTYHEVRLLAGHAKLITMDGPMRLRARADGVDVMVMNDKKYGRDAATSASGTS